MIVAHKKHLTENEKLSLNQCCTVLGAYEIILICPKGLDVSEYREINSSINVDFIDPKWQANYQTFNRLKIDLFLYNRYKHYQFILFYELDAWVFRDELKFWCEQNYDFIGAPWYEEFHNAKQDSKFIGVGNGGFSLRKTSSCIKVLRSFSYIVNPFKLAKEYSKVSSIKDILTLVSNFTIKNNTYYLFNDFNANEDYFWCNIAAKNFDWFRIPKEDIALKFSMETRAPELFEQNASKTPFGCHAWERYHKDFWIKYIV